MKVCSITKLVALNWLWRFQNIGAAVVASKEALCRPISSTGSSNATQHFLNLILGAGDESEHKLLTPCHHLITVVDQDQNNGDEKFLLKLAQVKFQLKLDDDDEMIVDWTLECCPVISLIII